MALLVDVFWLLSLVGLSKLPISLFYIRPIVLFPYCRRGVVSSAGDFAGPTQISQINMGCTPNASNIRTNNVISKVNASNISKAVISNGKINVILPNCGPGVAPPGAEFTGTN